MATKRLPMRQIREILRLKYEQKLSHRLCRNFGRGRRGWGVSRDHRRRPLLRGGSAEPDPAALGRASEDGPERRGEAGAAASVGGADRGVGARRGARGDARPDAGVRGHEGDRGQGSAATGGVSAAS